MLLVSGGHDTTASLRSGRSWMIAWPTVWSRFASFPMRYPGSFPETR